MLRTSLLGFGFALALISAVAVSCGDDDAEDGTQEKFCDPGQFAFCKCRGDRPGTRECNSSGSAFGECLADDGDLCEEIPEGTGGSTGENLYEACADDTTCTGGTTCQNGYCTKSCASFVECKPPLGDCVNFNGAALCLPVCADQAQCNGSFGPTSKCSYTDQLIPMSGGGFTGCANWSGDPVLPPDGHKCLTNDAPDDAKCNLGLEAAQRICGDNGECTSGCHSTSDCPSGTSCDPGSATCTMGCQCGDGTCDTQCEDDVSCPADCMGAPVEGDKCPGELVQVSIAGGTVIVQGDTSLAPPPSEAKGEGGCTPTSTATEELIYQVTPSDSGTLLILLEPEATFDSVLYARSGSCTTGQQIGCDDAFAPGESEIIEIPATAGEKVSVFVDGYNGSVGSFTLQILLSAN